MAEAGGPNRAFVMQFGAIAVTRELELRLVPSAAIVDHLPVISGIEAIIESEPVAMAE